MVGERLAAATAGSAARTVPPVPRHETAMIRRMPRPRTDPFLAARVSPPLDQPTRQAYPPGQLVSPARPAPVGQHGAVADELVGLVRGELFGYPAAPAAATPA